MARAFFSTTDLFCHDVRCKEFNRPNPFPVKPATWESPPEVPDTDCPSCGGDLWDTPLDVERMVLDLVEPLGELEFEQQRLLFAQYKKVLTSWQRMVIKSNSFTFLDW